MDAVIFDVDGTLSVSYTHLDVYKRQLLWTYWMGRCRTGKSGIILHTCGSNWHDSIAYDTFKGGSAINENEKRYF